MQKRKQQYLNISDTILPFKFFFKSKIQSYSNKKKNIFLAANVYCMNKGEIDLGMNKSRELPNMVFLC